MAVVVDEALSQLGIDEDFEIIGNPRLFSKYGVQENMTLMIRGKILAAGSVPKIDDMVELIREIFSKKDG